MIIFKNNEIKVEDPKTIELNGVYYGIVIRSVAMSDSLVRSYIYIPEVYGPYDHIYSRVADYPSIEIPIKQDSDDVGHIPATGELVKVSFDNGSDNDCRFCFLVPVGQEQIIRNANYITKGILSADIFDINDPDIVNKMLELLEFAYYVTIGKTTPSKEDYEFKWLVNDTSIFYNCFLSPLTLPLTTIYGSVSMDLVPIFSSIPYILTNVMLKIFDANTEDLKNAFNNPPKYNVTAQYNPDYLDLEDLQKAQWVACQICGIPPAYAKLLFNNVDSTIDKMPTITFEMLWNSYVKDVESNIGENYYGNFVYKNRTYFEEEWASSCASWLSGINAIVPTDINPGYKAIIIMCLTICPWMASAILGYNLSNFTLQNKAEHYFSEDYKFLYGSDIQERSYNTVFSSDEKFIEAQEKIYNVLDDKTKDYNDFIDVFEEVLKDVYNIDGTDKMWFSDNVWDMCDMSNKFKRLRNKASDIVEKWNSLNVSVPGGDGDITGMTWCAKEYYGYTRTSTEAKNNATIVYKILSGTYGWTLNAVSALLGNIEWETGYNPWRWGYDEVLPSTGYHREGVGYGLVQFTPPQKYIDSPVAKSSPGYAPHFSDVLGSPNDGTAQIHFLATATNLWYAVAPYNMSYDEFKHSTASPTYLSSVFLDTYERPADPEATRADRAEAASFWFSYLQGV